ncbi:MAG: lipid kinase [Streptosporangiales bacterium]|nr:lipid kinase [Streptosporangiales bacterium]
MLVITNRQAGGAEDGALEAAAAVLRRDGKVSVVSCRSPQDVDAVLEGYPDEGTLVVAGGDGSLHAVVAALHRRGELARRRLGLIPLGTGNDFARALGLPLDVAAAAHVVRDGQVRELDLLADDAGGVAVNAVHAGAGARAALAAAPWKRWLGPAAFPLGGVLAGVTARGWRLRVEADGAVLADGSDRILMVGVANTPSIAGGTAVLAAHAAPDDGLADVVISYATGPLTRLGYALRLRHGQHTDHPDVSAAQATTVTISGEDFPINTDGEVGGPVGRRTWTVLPRAWRVLAPDRPPLRPPERPP